MDGVKNNLEAPASVNQDIFNMTPAEKDAAGIESLPGNLKEALDLLAVNPVAKEALGEHILTKFLAGKEKEWDSFRTAVTDWERQAYLTNY